MTVNNQNTRTNILILGKTGSGKSSLLNYLFGDNAAKVGHGRPTTTEGIHQHEPFDHNGVSFVIYDSWGLEADKATRWKQLISEEVEKNNAKEVRDWFHTVIYCVDAERARVDDFEVQDVLSPLLEGGNRILFALTKPGLNEEHTQETQKVLEKFFPDCNMIEVESVSARFIGGRQILQRGREELLDKICYNLRDNIVSKAIEKYKRDTRKILCSRLTSETMRYFDDKAGTLGIFTHYGEDFKDDIGQYAKRTAQSILARTGDELKENISVGQEIISEVCDAVRVNDLHLFDIDINHLIADVFSEWDNGWETYAATIIAQIIFPLGIIARKGVMSDVIKTGCIRLVDSLEKSVDTYSDKLYDKLGVKKHILRKSNIGTAIHERKMFDIFRELEKQHQK